MNAHMDTLEKLVKEFPDVDWHFNPNTNNFTSVKYTLETLGNGDFALTDTAFDTLYFGRLEDCVQQIKEIENGK
jgi:hypothetical protein